MSLLNRLPIRRQIIAVTGALVAFLTLAVAWSVDRSRREREAEVSAQAGAVAVTAAAYLNQYLSGFDFTASTLSKHPFVTSLDHDRCEALFAALLREQPLLINVVLTDAAGVIKGSGLGSMPSVGPVVTLPYVKEVVSTGRPVVSELMTGQFTGKPTVVLGYPVFDAGGAVIGTIGLGVNLTALQTVFASIPLPEGSVITVTDPASRVLARSRDPERYIGTAVVSRPVAPRDVSPSQIVMGIDGVPRFFGNAVIDRGPWLLSVGIPLTVVNARLAPLLQRDLAIAAATIWTVFTLSLWFSGRLSVALDRLRLAARRIAAGDLSTPIKEPVPSRELSDLQDAFVTMAANLREARQALDRQVDQERKIREALQSLQRQVVRQERLAAVGVLVSGVAHELNNPLQAILGTVELLERHQNLSTETLNEIAFVKVQSGRAREIIRNLSRFSRQQTGPPAFVDLRDVITEVVQLRHRDLGSSSIELEVDSSSYRRVHTNFTEIEQVLLNFVINAQQSIEAAGRPKGRILIRLIDSGRNVRVEVHDDGPGVAPEDEPKLFQPFFTTKPVGKGTGLGLSVSYGIIESYGGTIGYTGNAWGGATFFFELAAADAPAIQTDDGASLLHRSIPSKV